MCKAVRKQELGKQLAPFCRKEKQYNTVKMRKQATDSIGTFTGQKAKHYFFLFFFSFYKESKNIVQVSGETESALW